ncbi:MAG: Do family serine endopeptidase [Acidobacteria bacterium]|nr:Do family serine endopeptidase [Acidobacteriota bacterium]
MRTQRGWYIPVLAVLLTFGVGVGIGALVSRSVRPAHPTPASASAAEAAPLAIPSPIELSNSFSRVAEEIEPAVVNINTETTVQVSRRYFGSPDQEPFGDFFNHFFNFPNRKGKPDSYQRRSLGSGIILDPKGYVLTNYHVVMQTRDDKPVDRIEVYLHGDSGAKYRARIVGADKATDLAVIKIDAGKPLAAAQFGDSNSVRVGDWVLAIGSPFGLNSTVTAGIISAKGRDIEPGIEGQFKRFIQTDAAINPGNSGGPLVNLAGQIIGVNTAIATSQGSNDGIGFAIPSNTARKVYNALIATGHVPRGAIGVTFQSQNNPALLRSFGANHGVVVDSVEPGSPAERAGLKRGDVILAIDGHPIRSGDELVRIISDRKIGSELQINLLRNGKPVSASVEVGDRNQIIATQRAEAERGTNDNSPEQAGGTLGMSVRDLTPEQAMKLQRALQLGKQQGVLVTQVVPEGFAAELGIEREDVVLAVNHHSVSSAAEFTRLQSTLKSGNDVLLLIARRTGSTFTTLFLADRLP